MRIDKIKIGERYRKELGDLSELVASIKEQGLLQPIGITKDNELVFGQRRLEACKQLGYTEVDTHVVNVKSIVEGENDENSMRKDFTFSERKAIADKVKEVIGNRAGRPSKLIVHPGAQLKGKKTRDIASDKAGFKSREEYRRVSKVVDTGIEELVDAMDEEIIDVTSAAKLASKPKPEQKKILKKIKSGEAKSVGHANALEREEKKVQQYKIEVKTKPTVACSHYKDWLNTQPDCDLLLTDPPYSTDVKDINEFAKEWLPVALSKVKPTGSAYICVGAYPEEVQAYLNVKLPYQILIWTYNNATLLQPDKKYMQNYQMILLYKNPDTIINKPNTVMEQFASQTINAPDGRKGDRYHTWQKPSELAERIIMNSSKKGDLILDPFTCTGTFILAANKLGRIGRGCDISKENIKLAIKRGCENE